MRNNNASVIYRLAFKQLKANKLRNAFVISAIILICILFTTVFTITKGIGDVAQAALMKEAGSDFHAAFENVSDAQIEHLSKHPYIKEFSITTTYLPIGFSETKYMSVDDVFWKHAIQSDEQYSPFSNVVFVDSDFAENNSDLVSFSYNQLYVLSDNSYFLNMKMNKVLRDTGIEASFSINNAYTSTLFEEPSSLLLLALPLILIMACGYLLIYNIFYISAVNDVRAYGLLKTIGTTGKQLKKVVFIATNVLYLIALPVGLLLGNLIGSLVLTPLVLSLSGIDITVNSGPFPFVFTAVFTYATLIISIIQPQKIVARVSPVAALRYTDPSVMTHLSTLKHRTGKVNIGIIAWRNLQRNRGRTVFSIVSVTIGIIIFAVLFNIFSNVRFDAYTNKYYGGSLILFHTTLNYIHESESRITEELIERTRTIEGVNSVDEIYLNLYNPVNDDSGGANVVDVYGLPNKLDDILKDNQKGILSGRFDLEKWQSGGYVIVSQPMYPPAVAYKAGDMIDIGHSSGKLYEIMLVTEKQIYFASSLYANQFKAYIPASEFTDSYLSPSKVAVICKLIIDTEMGWDETVKMELSKMFPQDSGFLVQARSDELSDLRQTVFVMQAVGYSMTIIIALIGLLNFVNSFLAGAFSRKMEYAMLQSIGMSGKQLRRMLLLEGGYCAGIITVISFVLGSLLSNFATAFAARNMDFFTAGVNYWWGLLVAVILCASLYILTSSIHKLVSHKSLVERLREAE